MSLRLRSFLPALFVLSVCHAVPSSAARFADPPAGAVTATMSGTPTVDGRPLEAGDEVAVFCVHPDPAAAGRWRRTLIGHAVVSVPGTLPAFSVNGDDPATDNVVEGAAAGEDLQLILWRASESREYAAYADAAGLPAAVTWPGEGGLASVDGLVFLEGQRIPLRTGAWNLFSYGVLKGWHRGATLPASAQLPGLAWDNGASLGDTFPLRSIAGRYDRVLGNDGASTTVWNPAFPGSSTLSYLAPGYGYWVKMKPSAGALAWMTFPGPRATGGEGLSLGTGWTLCGAWGNTVYHIATWDASGGLLPVDATDNETLASIGDLWGNLSGSYARVTSFDGEGVHLWNPSLPQIASLKYMGPGYGYWIKTTRPTTLSSPKYAAPPTGVTATPGNATVTVSWNSVPGATLYKVYWSGTPGVTRRSGTLLAVVSTTSRAHTPLTNGQPYHYIVTSVVAGVEGGESAEATATPVAPPPAPGSPSAGLTDNSVILTWSAVPEASVYHVYAATSQSGPAVRVATLPGTQYDNGALAVGTRYYYSVTGENAGGESPHSARVGAAPKTYVPGVPPGVSVTADDARNTVAWGEVAEASAYTVYWGRDNNVSRTTADNSAALPWNARQYVHPGLVNGVTYYYAVTAMRAGVESAESAVVSARPQRPVTLGSPPAISATAGDNAVTLSWTGIVGATSYNVYWSTGPGVTKSSPNLIPLGNVGQHNHAGRTNGTTYYYVVTAVNAAGESGESPEAIATPRAIVPGAPYPVTALAGDGQVSVGWGGVSGAAGYVVYWSETPGVTKSPSNRIPLGNVGQHAHMGRTNGTTCYYAVAAMTGAGTESELSAEVSATPRAIVPGAP